MAAAPDHVTSQTASGPASARPAAFNTTHWSVVLQAQGESPAAQEALEDLCRTYWRPIYGFVRREGARPEEAKDITQGFFALILERKDFSSVRQEKGHLRSFLLASLKHFMANERRDAATLKRGGGRTLLPLDEAESYDLSDFDDHIRIRAKVTRIERTAFDAVVQRQTHKVDLRSLLQIMSKTGVSSIGVVEKRTVTGYSQQKFAVGGMRSPGHRGDRSAYRFRSVPCHPERSEAESKDPAELPEDFATGFLDFARNDRYCGPLR